MENSHNKYVNVKKEGAGIAHCPHCRGVILRDFGVNKNNGTSFKIRCPHCQKDISVSINDKNLIIHPEN